MSSRGERRVKISRDKLVGLVVALACLAFSAIGLRVNDPPEFTYVDGVRDQPVSIEQSEVTVGEVGVGTRLIRNGEMQAETEGMFVIVEVTLAVPGNRRVNLNHAQLITKRRAYDGWSGATVRAEPGFQSEEQLIFEVDPAQIDDLSLEIWAMGVVYGFYQRARIHLGITPENADRWRRNAVGRALTYELSGSMTALP